MNYHWVAVQIGKLRPGIEPWPTFLLLQGDLPTTAWSQRWLVWGMTSKGKQEPRVRECQLPQFARTRMSQQEPWGPQCDPYSRPDPTSSKHLKVSASLSHSHWWEGKRTSYFALKKWALTSLFGIRKKMPSQKINHHFYLQCISQNSEKCRAFLHRPRTKASFITIHHTYRA